jgi:hypothetical protein
MINNEELFRIVNFPSIEGYLATISKDEDEALITAESTIMGLRNMLDIRMNQLNYYKLKREFGFSLQTSHNDDLHDYSTADVAQILKRSPAQIRNYINAGRLKSYRMDNGDIRITVESLRHFVNSLRDKM